MRAGRSGPMVIRQRRRFHSLVRPELASALASMNIHAPNVVQAAALRRALSGADLLCVAQTGSGKTLMFLLPLLERLQAGEAAVRSEVNIELNFPPNFEGLVLGCIDADFCK